MIYLDNCATTQVKREILEEMLPFFIDSYGNPDSKYYDLALQSQEAIIKSKNRIASFFNCNFNEVYFNSGSTEGNNTIIKGVADYYSNKGKHIITTCVEHSSILETCRFLEKKGYRITYLPVNKQCQINLDDLKKAICNETILVSVMWVNNEVGSIMPIQQIAHICKKNKILFHSDATQAIGRIDINLDEYDGLNFITFSGHKIYGPKGIGCLISRRDAQNIEVPYSPLIHGGGQENGFRAGTSNMPGIVGLGKACEIQMNTIKHNIFRLTEIDLIIKSILIKKFKDIIYFNNDFERVPGIINIRFKGINNQILLKNISHLVAASTGSACSNLKPSYVLLSMGYNQEHVSESIRFSFSPYIDNNDLNVLDNL